MTRARRAGVTLTIGALLVLGAGPGAAAAQDDALATAWQGPTVSLAWDGSTYSTTSTSFSGTPVVVPGDVQGRTITVRNDGPTDAVLRGWVHAVDLLDPGARDVHHATGVPQGDFYSDLTLAWRTASDDGSASFRQLAAAGRTAVVDVPLPRGASTEVTLVTALPLEADSGNRANVAPRRATYEFLLRLDGRVPGATEPGSSGSGVPQAGGDGISTGPGVSSDAALGHGERARSPDRSAALALTGLEAVRAALLAVVGIGTGSLLLGAARRRRDASEADPRGVSPAPR
ncbi:hypothetical protein [Cellulomonas sp. KH9]|uniref:hypothetical protein n=1 Tax=Cellulomonas sp. KH9 TaxID=1855324 RepID=UPI0008ECEAAF|nr:hypothetical protein [Cellulomonas sp. KH9]SFJ80533.1 hypothetical protein SAMN05216467_1055 [Cellulomonas sp. KH9]